MKCSHQHLKRIDLEVYKGIVNRKVIICKDCGRLLDSEEYYIEYDGEEKVYSNIV